MIIHPEDVSLKHGLQIRSMSAAAWWANKAPFKGNGANIWWSIRKHLCMANNMYTGVENDRKVFEKETLKVR